MLLDFLDEHRVIRRKQPTHQQGLGQIQGDEVTRKADNERDRMHADRLHYHRDVGAEEQHLRRERCGHHSGQRRRIAPVGALGHHPRYARREGGRSCPAAPRRHWPVRRRRWPARPTPVIAPAIHATAFVPDGLHQLPHPDDDAKNQAADEKPGRRATPVVDGIAEPAAHDDRADNRVGQRLRAGPACSARCWNALVDFVGGDSPLSLSAIANGLGPGR